MIRILIAEDSGVVAMLLRAMFEHEADLEVVGHARDGRAAVEMAQRLKPDLVTMDIRMPVMDGFEATREIMAAAPCPIVVISSSVDDEELRITFRAVEEGALAVIEKPRGLGHPDFESVRRELITTVRAMAEVKVVRRRRWQTRQEPRPAEARPEAAPGGGRPLRDCEVIGIAASTGGPQALRTVLGSLPAELAVPVLVVQHIGTGFLQGMVDWLDGHAALEVRMATEWEELRPGRIYFAAEERHLEVTRAHGRLLAALRDEPPVAGLRPSANPLFSSIARHCPGTGVGVVLSGMGEDGASGLLAMHQGGCRTLAQDEESCVVYGMPGAAVARGAVDEVVALDRIAERLVRYGGVAGMRTVGT